MSVAMVWTAAFNQRLDIPRLTAVSTKHLIQLQENRETDSESKNVQNIEP